MKPNTILGLVLVSQILDCAWWMTPGSGGELFASPPSGCEQSLPYKPFELGKLQIRADWAGNLVTSNSIPTS